MPKIVVREFDYTTAPGAPYSNFAVVVPGFCSASAKDVFDENGVYECKNQDDFKNNIGLVSPKEHTVKEAEAPKVVESWSKEGKALTKSEFDTLVTKGNLYKVTTVTDATIGELRNGVYKYELATTSCTYDFISAVEGGSTTGQTPAPASTGEGEGSGDDIEVELTKFTVLETKGNNKQVESHYGNQITWELLGLGYTVLYKKLDSTIYLSSESFWKPLKDKTLYDFRYLMSGLLAGTKEVNDQMVKVAHIISENESFDTIDPLVRGRGDCIALLDIAETAYKGKNQSDAIDGILNATKDDFTTKSKYAAIFVPTVTYSSVDSAAAFENNKTFPASFHYLACAARSSETYNEWYANAGYTRGISKYTVESVGCKLGEAAVNVLQKRTALKETDASGNITKAITVAVNPIINLRGNYYIWGNRTAHLLNEKDSKNPDLQASHFLNIRQLCSTIKKQVYVSCRQLTFDPNSDTLWTNFCNSIIPMLEDMKADQGISDYKIIKVKNPRKAFLSAIIRIVPIEAVEDFDISVYLEDSIGGKIAATVEE